MAMARSALLLLGMCLVLQAASAQSCGYAGQDCCCPYGGAGECCKQPHLTCTIFSGTTFSGARPKTMCVSKTGPGCGTKGNACCVYSDATTRALKGSCGFGLVCVPPKGMAYNSKKQYDAMKDKWDPPASAVGTCESVSGGSCGGAHQPCGKDPACGGRTVSCPSGYYCANSFDTGVGDRCLPLPSRAGSAGAPCLPGNLRSAPTVNVPGFGSSSMPHCNGANTYCIINVKNADGFMLGKASEARSSGARITGSLCVDIPSTCGNPGQRCCPSTYNIASDKPLPSWGGNPCNNAASPKGVWCDGSYYPEAGVPLGTCRANTNCGDVGQPCCYYTNSRMKGNFCTGFQPIQGICEWDGISHKCKRCPETAYTVNELLRCV